MRQDELGSKHKGYFITFYKFCITVIDICNKFLNNPEEKDSNDMRDRIEWIKELSEDGYYISYESL